MSYRTLGRTALQVGPLALGTVNFGYAAQGGGFTAEESDNFRMMYSALERGLNHFDTSNNYNAGRAEEIIGRFMKERGGREEIVLVTKLYCRPNDWGSPDPEKQSGSYIGPNQRGLSAKHIIEACNASLKRLQTDYIDIYQMHHVDRAAPFEEIWQAFEVLVQQGKVIYVGTSNFAGWHIAKACERASARNFLGPVSEQSIYSLMNRTVELEVIPACCDYGMAFIPYSPAAGGLLAVAGGMEGGHRSMKKFNDATPKVLEQLVRYAEVCRDIGHAPADIAIAWVAANPNVTAPIIGPRTMEHLDSAIAALDITLDEEIMVRLDEIFPGPGGEAPEAYAW